MARPEDEALRRAILDYDLEEAEKLLRAGADPNVLIESDRARSPGAHRSIAPSQFRALHLAANDDDVELAALLLLHGASQYQKIYAGTLPISIAAEMNHLATAELLLHEYRRPAGSFACPLAKAAYSGHLAMVELLLAKKPDEMAIDAALGSAVARKGNLAVTQRLLAAGASAGWMHPNADPKTADTTRMRAMQPQPEALPLLVGHEHVRIIDAAFDGDLPAVERFLAEGASPDDADSHGYTTALTAASRCGRTDVVRRLLDAGASLYGPKNKSDPLYRALEGPHTETADFLWSVGCRTDNMVERAAFFLPVESMPWVLDRKRDANTALHAAVRQNRVDVARLALERGADPGYRPRHKLPPLLIAANRRHLEMVELLIAHGANVQAVDDQGWTVMHYAILVGDPVDPDDDCYFDHSERSLGSPVVQLLLRHGVPIPRQPQ